MYLNILPKWCLIFAVMSRKHKKWTIFYILMNTPLQVSILTWQMAPFFSSTHWDLSVGIFIFAFQDIQNSVPWGPPPPLHYVLVCKIQIYIPKMILPSLLTSLLAYKPINLLTFSVYFGNNMVPIPRTTLNKPEASNFIKKRL